MKKSNVNAFTKSANTNLPSLESVGEVVGMGLGNAAKFMDKLITGIKDIAMGRESAGISNLASSSPRVSQQVAERSNTVPYALSAKDQLAAAADAAAGGKGPMAKVASGFSKGFTSARNAPDKPKPKKGPAFSPT